MRLQRDVADIRAGRDPRPTRIVVPAPASFPPRLQRLHVRHTLANVDGILTLPEPKTSRSRRTVSLPETAVSSLRGQRIRQLMERLVGGSRWVETGHVLATTIGTRLHAAPVSRAFKAALSRAWLPDSRFHDLRHATATFLLAMGMGLEDVKNQLGRSSITLPLPADMRKALERRDPAREGLPTALGESADTGPDS